MFEPTQRHNFLDLLRPPAGYRLESAVGTTYSLDFVALTATLLAFVDAEAESDENAATAVDSLHAITRLAERVRVFVNRGQIAGPRKLSRVTTLYDRIIHEVCLSKGCFHPKVWVAHYQPRKNPGNMDRPGLLRIICASRNLTTSQCWEAFIALEGKVGEGKVKSSVHAGIDAFLAQLGATDSRPSPNLARVRAALARTTFELSRPMQGDASFLWQWNNGQALHRHLPVRGRRALIVSPFVRKVFLEDIVDRCEQTIVVSSQRELDMIADDEFIARLCRVKNRVYVVRPVDTEEGDVSMNLHAKILIVEGAGESTTFLGSANASSSGWRGNNCEALLKFSPGVSIDHFCDRFIYDDAPAIAGHRPLRGWIAEYQRQPFVEDEHERAQRQLDEICIGLARLTLFAEYDPVAQRLRLTTDAVPSELAAQFGKWASLCDMQLALLSQLHSDAALQPFAGLLNGDIVFAEVRVADITEFVVLQVRSHTFGLQKRFILKVKADFTQWREQRDAQLLKELLTRDNLQAFLRAILFDAAVRPPPRPPAEPPGKSKNGGAAGSLLSDLSIEDVIRSCTEDTSRIDEINRILIAFEMTEWIDEEFRRFWATFVAAESEAREAASHG